MIDASELPGQIKFGARNQTKASKLPIIKDVKLKEKIRQIPNNKSTASVLLIDKVKAHKLRVRKNKSITNLDFDKIKIDNKGFKMK
tara:strand:+ start:108 stop:365 length:258 start_codon:yes stop_codon:yes gene_type:complete